MEGFSEDPLESDVLTSVNRALQHVTVYRQADHIPWKPVPILRPIVEAMGRFIDRLAEEDPKLAARLIDVHQRGVDLLDEAERLIASVEAKSRPLTLGWISYAPSDDDDDDDSP